MKTKTWQQHQHQHEVKKKWKQTCNQTYVAPSSICVLSLCRGRFYPHIGPRSILFYFCAWFVKMFYFYLNENLIKKLHYRWNMQTNIRFPFFSGSFFRFCVCFFFVFFAENSSCTSFTFVRTHAQCAKCIIKPKFVFIGNLLILLCIEKSTIKRTTAVSSIRF